MAQKFRFVRDDDGHNYLIVADDYEEFENWVSHSDDPEGWAGKWFDENRIDGISRWTFENPQMDED
jgi:uncharacterized protein YbdZ (MbtH family)